MQLETRIALYCPAEHYRKRIESALPQVVGTHASDWEALLRVTPSCRCAVVVIERLTQHDDVARVRALRRDFPQIPVVAVTLEDPNNARCAFELGVSDILWTDEIEQRLAGVVARAVNKRFFTKLALLLDAATHLPTKLRTALQYACLATRPPRSVKLLAGQVGCHRGTLSAQWGRAVGVTTLRLECFLDWLVLLAAAERKTPGRSWAAVASELRVHDHTLGRVARRLTGWTLREIERLGGSGLATAFSDRVLDVVIGGPTRATC